jgi:hypothetical protein
MVLNATFNTISIISWRSVLLVEETRVHGENYLPDTNHIMLYRVHGENYRPDTNHIMLYRVHLTINGGSETTTFVVVGTDCTDSCKSYYHTITTAPYRKEGFLKKERIPVGTFFWYLIFIASG